MKWYAWIVAAIFSILPACTAYRPMPLDMKAERPHEVPHLNMDISKIPLPVQETCHFNPDDGLDITEVAILAVVNNPDLKLARDEAKIVSAQAFNAGLLPNPQLSAGVDFPTDNVAGSNFSAFNLGLGYDLTALVTRGTATAAANQKARQADLTLLWQEWQVAGRARLLFSKSLYSKRWMRILIHQRDLLADRYKRAQKALTDGNITQGAVDTDMAVLSDINRQVNDLARQMTADQHDLARLLGLSADVRLNLVGEAVLAPLDKVQIASLVDRLAYRRPDLLALKAGFESQDFKYRQSILEQFPAIGIGISHARDTSDIHTLGLSITLNLPLFNQNQGRIAIEDASRKRLHDEFENRLADARNSISQIVAEQDLIEIQLKATDAELEVLNLSVQNARKAFSAGNLYELDYITLQTGLFNKRLEQLRLQQMAVEQRIALETLLGSDMPRAFEEERNPS